MCEHVYVCMHMCVCGYARVGSSKPWSCMCVCMHAHAYVHVPACPRESWLIAIAPRLRRTDAEAEETFRASFPMMSGAATTDLQVSRKP